MSYYAVHRSNSDDELMHYGVLGMKWGIRKARKQGVDYAYKSHGQKRTEKKLEKQINKNANTSKIRNTQSKLDHLKRRDENRQKYAESTSVGKTVVKGLLMGPFGSGNYNRLRASGSTRLYSAMASNIISSTLTLPIQALVSRDREFRSSR